MKKYLDMINLLNLSQIHKDLIVGVLLGDGHIIPGSNLNAKIKFDQGLDNKDYLYFLYEIMKSFCLSEPKERIYTDERYKGTIYYSYNFSTKQCSAFYPFSELFLDKTEKTGKYIKIVPECIEELLTPGALAFWLMDDGQHVERGGVTLCTDNFTYDEVQFLKSVLEKKYKLICTIHNKNIKKGYYRIYISAKSLPILQPLVFKYFHPSMLYKIQIKNL